MIVQPFSITPDQPRWPVRWLADWLFLPPIQSVIIPWRSITLSSVASIDVLLVVLRFFFRVPDGGGYLFENFLPFLSYIDRSEGVPSNNSFGSSPFPPSDPTLQKHGHIIFGPTNIVVNIVVVQDARAAAVEAISQTQTRIRETA